MARLEPFRDRLLASGRYPDAHGDLREALSLYRGVGDRRGEAKALNNLGRMQPLHGHHRDALEAYQKSLQIFREIGGAQSQAILYHNIGTSIITRAATRRHSRPSGARCAIYRDIGDLPDEADVLNDIGAIYQSAACYDEALIHHEKARLIAQEIGNLSQQLIALRAGLPTYIAGRTGTASNTLNEYTDISLWSTILSAQWLLHTIWRICRLQTGARRFRDRISACADCTCAAL